MQYPLRDFVRTEARAVMRVMDNSADVEGALRLILLGVYERGKEAGKAEERKRMEFRG